MWKGGFQTRLQIYFVIRGNNFISALQSQCFGKKRCWWNKELCSSVFLSLLKVLSLRSRMQEEFWWDSLEVSFVFLIPINTPKLLVPTFPKLFFSSLFYFDLLLLQLAFWVQVHYGSSTHSCSVIVWDRRICPFLFLSLSHFSNLKFRSPLLHIN